VVEQTFGGVAMVLVPPGCFMMGDQGTGGRQCFDQPFWIDKYEVTNRQFAQFGGQAARRSDWTDDNYPRERITLFEARDFCAKRGARLPTEAEWEYAARGPDGLAYPWGNQFLSGNVVYGGNSGRQPADVGSKPGGISWVGGLDLSGNVWEWVSSLAKPYPYGAMDGRESNSDTSSERVIRGGSWGDNMNIVRATNRYWFTPSSSYGSGGFRCARFF
jgi:formylglycine-generating enzyme required for sulfatase activity